MQINTSKQKRVPQKTLSFTLCLLTLLALFVRIQYFRETVITHPIGGDARDYVDYGYNLYAHGVFSKEIVNEGRPTPDAFRSPGYPFLISMAFFMGGKLFFYPIIIYAQIIMGALLVPLTFRIGERMYARSLALFAALLVAISSHLVAMTTYVLTETVFAFFLILTVYLFIMALEKERFFYFSAAGGCSGITYLVNETFFPLPFLLVGFAAFFIWRARRRNARNLFGSLCIYFMVFLMFPVGWELRNHTLGADRSGKSRALITLSHGAYPDFIYKNPEYKYYPYKEDPMQPQFGSSLKDFFHILKERVYADPYRYIVWYLIKKPYYVWSWDNLQSRMGEQCGRGEGDVYVYPVKTSLYFKSAAADVSRIIMKYLHPVFLLAAFAGILIVGWDTRRKKGSRSEQSTPWLLCIVVVYYTLLYTVFAPWPRYSVPLRPELYLFAVWAIQYIIKCLKEQKTRYSHGN